MTVKILIHLRVYEVVAELISKLNVMPMIKDLKKELEHSGIAVFQYFKEIYKEMAHLSH